MKEKIKEILKTKWEVQFFGKLSKIISDFSITEKVFFYTISAIFIVSGVILFEGVNKSVSVEVPANGGYLKEGIIGSPRFINPVLAVSDVDDDLTVLVYSGLLKASPDGTLTPDLAESYTISPDGLTYTFTLRDNAYFQDGTKVTTDDIEFTIGKIQDSTIKSPKRPEFYDVRVDKIDGTHIAFMLSKPYSPFLENLTVGILPKHLWNNLSNDEFPLSIYNVEPIGSGPYKVGDMKSSQKNTVLIPTYYDLIPFDKYTLGKPYINDLIINFYRDEQTLVNAYNNGDIEAMNSISPDKISSIKLQAASEIKTSPLPRSFAVFFNQNQSQVLALKEVRQALDLAVDRQELVDKVLSGYGQPTYGPIPTGLINSIDSSIKTSDYSIDAAKNVLLKAGWIQNATTGFMEKKISKKQRLELYVSIATLDSPDLIKAAQLVKNAWQKIGAKVDIKQFEFGDLQQNIIRPRKFDALLYGTVTGRDMDFFAFWHSSQRNDPGLNIAMYANSKVDKLLEDARKTSNISIRTEKYKQFNTLVEQDVPAVFLYSPEFIYITPKKVQEADLGMITLPYERFLNINTWYIETNNLWKIFQEMSIQALSNIRYITFRL